MARAGLIQGHSGEWAVSGPSDGHYAPWGNAAQAEMAVGQAACLSPSSHLGTTPDGFFAAQDAKLIVTLGIKPCVGLRIWPYALTKGSASVCSSGGELEAFPTVASSGRSCPFETCSALKGAASDLTDLAEVCTDIYEPSCTAANSWSPDPQKLPGSI